MRERRSRICLLTCKPIYTREQSRLLRKELTALLRMKNLKTLWRIKEGSSVRSGAKIKNANSIYKKKRRRQHDVCLLMLKKRMESVSIVKNPQNTAGVSAKPINSFLN